MVGDVHTPVFSNREAILHGEQCAYPCFQPPFLLKITS